jgi:putative oxidoreductase
MAGVMLVVGWRVRAAALLTALMMLSFMVALGFALHQGLNMSCGCFASQAAAKHDPISWVTMLRDGGWLVLGLYVLLFDHRPIGIERLLVKGH